MSIDCWVADLQLIRFLHYWWESSYSLVLYVREYPRHCLFLIVWAVIARIWIFCWFIIMFIVRWALHPFARRDLMYILKFGLSCWTYWVFVWISFISWAFHYYQINCFSQAFIIVEIGYKWLLGLISIEAHLPSFVVRFVNTNQ